MLDGSETWSVKKENEMVLHYTVYRDENGWIDVWCKL